MQKLPVALLTLALAGVFPLVALAQAPAGAEAATAGAERLKAGKFDEAIAEYTKAIAAEPDNAGYYQSRAFAYKKKNDLPKACLLYTSPSPRDQRGSRMPSSA